MNAMLKPIEIVNVENGEPMTTTLQIALGLEIQHATVIKLVRTYMPDFQEFGLVRFKIQPRLNGQHGGGDVKFVPLNEQQATFLMTLMRNSPRVIEFKKALVKAFFETREFIRSSLGLKTEAKVGEYTVNAKDIFSQIIPSAQTETPIIDVNAAGESVVLVAGSDGFISVDISTDISTSQNLYLGSSVMPSSLSFSLFGEAVTDQGGL